MLIGISHCGSSLLLKLHQAFCCGICDVCHLDQSQSFLCCWFPVAREGWREMEIDLQILFIGSSFWACFWPFHLKRFSNPSIASKWWFDMKDLDHSTFPFSFAVYPSWLCLVKFEFVVLLFLLKSWVILHEKHRSIPFPSCNLYSLF